MHIVIFIAQILLALVEKICLSTKNFCELVVSEVTSRSLNILHGTLSVNDALIGARGTLIIHTCKGKHFLE